MSTEPPVKKHKVMNDEDQPSSPPNDMSIILGLPEELTLCICSFLPVRDLLTFSTVCVQWEQFTADPLLWKELYETSKDKLITLVPKYPERFGDIGSYNPNNAHANGTASHEGGEVKYWKYFCRNYQTFDSIPEALKAAQPGNIIHLRPAVYVLEYVHITKPVHIIGIVDPSKVVLECKPDAGVLDVEIYAPDTSVPLALDDYDPLRTSASIRACTLVQTSAHFEALLEVVAGHALIEDCTLTSVSNECILVEGGTATIRRNTFSAQTAVHVMYDYSKNIIIEDNKISAKYCGIFIDADSTSRVRRNDITSAEYGIIIEQSRGIFEDNDIHDSEVGIELRAKSDPIVLRNKVHKSRDTGIILFESEGTFEGNEIYENDEGTVSDEFSNPKFKNNIVRNNKSQAFIVHGKGHFEKNTISDNVGGIEVWKTGTPTNVDNILTNNEIGLPPNIQECLDKGICTFSITNTGYAPQYWWFCDTCTEDEKGCCVACVDVCHKGHKLSQRNFSRFFCDCGAEWQCKAMPKNV